MNLKSPRSVIVTTEFCECLKQIVQSDQNVGLRTVLVYKALYLAAALGLKYNIILSAPNTHTIIIELPDGIGSVEWICPSNSDIVQNDDLNFTKFHRIEQYISSCF
ncbi:MAG: hypothetical protein WD512_15000 [Candidatus Paceibacterota bacterium]